VVYTIYDKQEKLWLIMPDMRFPPQLGKLIKNFYPKQYAKIQTANLQSKLFDVKVSVDMDTIWCNVCLIYWLKQW